MTADPFMERVQRSVLDGAGHRDVTVAESQRPVEWTTIVGPPLFDATWAAIEKRRQEAQAAADARVLAELSAAPRPSLWTRTPDWVIGAAAFGLVVAMFALALAR